MRLLKNATKEKLRGGFYTPNSIASFMLRWGFNGNLKMDILEPSCGDGVFIEEIRNGKYKYHSIMGVELDKKEAEKSRRLGVKNTKIINSDFHDFCISTKERYDLVVGNPPFIRYQYFNRDQQKTASRVFEKAGLKYSKLTNAWVSFVVGSSLLLKENGKMGFVLPAEILQVSYAQTLREFLAHFYNKITIVSFEKLVFPDIQQEIVLLLCEKNQSGVHLIEHLELRDADELQKTDIVKFKTPRKQIDFKTNKWTFYFLSQDEIDFLLKLKERKLIPRLGDYAKVEVGITTGANPFFTVPLAVVEKYNLENFARPMVGRSVQAPSVIFTKQDWCLNVKNGARTHLLVFPKIGDLKKEVGARKYINAGKLKKINLGYKNKIRDEWQIVPSLRISDALFIRRNNLYPKLIINDARAYTTDTMHRVSLKKDANIEAMVASYYNSLSLAFAEISGRSHGGGVLELMPNEAEEILLPYHEKNEKLLPIIDKMMREKKSISEILKFTNERILKQNYGFSNKDIAMADSIRTKLSQRRLNRGRKNS
jgi:adenine-specific DNA-methyltransferase